MGRRPGAGKPSGRPCRAAFTVYSRSEQLGLLLHGVVCTFDGAECLVEWLNLYYNALSLCHFFDVNTRHVIRR